MYSNILFYFIGQEKERTAQAPVVSTLIHMQGPTPTQHLTRIQHLTRTQHLTPTPMVVILFHIRTQVITQRLAQVARNSKAKTTKTALRERKSATRRRRRNTPKLRREDSFNSHAWIQQTLLTRSILLH